MCREVRCHWQIRVFPPQVISVNNYIYWSWESEQLRLHLYKSTLHLFLLNHETSNTHSNSIRSPSCLISVWLFSAAVFVYMSIILSFFLLVNLVLSVCALCSLSLWWVVMSSSPNIISKIWGKFFAICLFPSVHLCRKILILILFFSSS